MPPPEKENKPDNKKLEKPAPQAENWPPAKQDFDKQAASAIQGSSQWLDKMEKLDTGPQKKPGFAKLAETSEISEQIRALSSQEKLSLLSKVFEGKELTERQQLNLDYITLIRGFFDAFAARGRGGIPTTQEIYSGPAKWINENLNTIVMHALQDENFSVENFLPKDGVRFTIEKSGINLKNIATRAELLERQNELVTLLRTSKLYEEAKVLMESALQSEFKTAFQQIPLAKKEALQSEANGEIALSVDEDVISGWRRNGMTEAQIKAMKEGLADVEYNRLLHKEAAKNVLGESVQIPAEKTALWEYYINMLDAKDSLWSMSDKWRDTIINEIAINAPLIALSGGVGSAVRAGASGAAKEFLASHGAKIFGKAAVERALAGTALRTAGTVHGLLVEGAVFDVVHRALSLPIDGQWYRDLPDFAQSALWSAATLGLFHGSGKMAERLFTKTVLAGGKEVASVTRLGEFVGQIAHPGVREIAKILIAKGHIEAATMLVTGAIQNGAYTGNLDDFFKNFGDEVLHSYITVGALKTGHWAVPKVLIQRRKKETKSTEKAKEKDANAERPSEKTAASPEKPLPNLFGFQHFLTQKIWFKAMDTAESAKAVNQLGEGTYLAPDRYAAEHWGKEIHRMEVDMGALLKKGNVEIRDQMLKVQGYYDHETGQLLPKSNKEVIARWSAGQFVIVDKNYVRDHREASIERSPLEAVLERYANFCEKTKGLEEEARILRDPEARIVTLERGRFKPSLTQKVEYFNGFFQEEVRRINSSALRKSLPTEISWETVEAYAQALREAGMKEKADMIADKSRNFTSEGMHDISSLELRIAYAGEVINLAVKEFNAQFTLAVTIPDLVERKIPSLNAVLDIHKSNMDGWDQTKDYGMQKEIGGQFRRINEEVAIGDHAPPSSKYIPELMFDFGRTLDRLTEEVIQMNRDSTDIVQKQKNATALATWAHQKLVDIHPFYGGNGRTARCFFDYVFQRIMQSELANQVVPYRYVPIDRVSLSLSPDFNHFVATQQAKTFPNDSNADMAKKKATSREILSNEFEGIQLSHILRDEAYQWHELLSFDTTHYTASDRFHDPRIFKAVFEYESSKLGIPLNEKTSSIFIEVFTATSPEFQGFFLKSPQRDQMVQALLTQSGTEQNIPDAMKPVWRDFQTRYNQHSS